MFLDEGQRSRVIDAWGYRHTRFQSRTLRLILQARLPHCPRAGADKVQTRLLHGCHHDLIFGHEAVARKDSVVAVLLSYRGNLSNSCFAIGFIDPRVIGHSVHTLRLSDQTEFGSERPWIGNRILL